MKTPKEESFFNKLMDETLNHNLEEYAPLAAQEMGQYFEARNQKDAGDRDNLLAFAGRGGILLETLSRFEVPIYFGHYLQKIGCFRFYFGDLVLDFPQNWSLFSKIHEDLFHKGHHKIYKMQADEDARGLIPIFRDARPELEDALIVTCEGLILICMVGKNKEFLESKIEQILEQQGIRLPLAV